MRETYGDNLDEGNLDEAFSSNDKAKLLRSQIAQQEKARDSYLEAGNTEAAEALQSNIQKKKDELDSLGKQPQTLDDVSQKIDQTKIDSMAGQARGIDVNRDKGVDYSEMAQYSEQSKQQSTQAKIETQGGVERAVATDVTESSLKAAKQQESVSSELQQQYAKSLMDGNSNLGFNEAQEVAVWQLLVKIQ